MRIATQAHDHTHVFLSRMWSANRRISDIGKVYYGELYKACAARDLDRVERLIRDMRIDMAGVILQDRVRTAELRILPGVLTDSELARLRATRSQMGTHWRFSSTTGCSRTTRNSPTT